MELIDIISTTLRQSGVPFHLVSLPREQRVSNFINGMCRTKRVEARFEGVRKGSVTSLIARGFAVVGKSHDAYFELGPSFSSAEARGFLSETNPLALSASLGLARS